ncbi:hypothetical protein ACTXT7_014402 [Hymenolepis weldensis]
MRTSVTSAILLVLVIAQTQAFFTLFEEDLRYQPTSHRRQMTDREMAEAEFEEAEAEAEAEANAEHTNPEEPVGVTQQDIALLRRDVMVAMEHLRQAIERNGGRVSFMHNPWQYPYHYSHNHQQQQ